MTAVGLLVLGAIHRRGRAHGYQVRADLERWAAHEWATAKPGSIYHALKAMAKQGLLRGRDKSSDAGGPPRTEYELTAKGRAEYRGRLRRALAARDVRLDLLAAAVGLIDDLPRGEALELLRQRVETMDARGTRLWPRTCRVVRISRSGDPWARSSPCGCIPLRAAPNGRAS